MFFIIISEVKKLVTYLLQNLKNKFYRYMFLFLVHVLQILSIAYFYFIALAWSITWTETIMTYVRKDGCQGTLEVIQDRLYRS